MTLQERVEEKIDHSWNGRLFAFQDNSMEYIDVTNEVQDSIDQQKDEILGQIERMRFDSTRDEILRDLNTPTQTTLDKTDLRK